jgi:hypothetical protein
VGAFRASLEHVLRLRGVVYDVGRAMGAHSPSWRPDYSPALVGTPRLRRPGQLLRSLVRARRLGPLRRRRCQPLSQIQGLTAERYLAKIGQLQATGKPVAITEFGATHPGVGWEPKEAFHAIARYYRQQEPGLRPAQG